MERFLGNIVFFFLGAFGALLVVGFIVLLFLPDFPPPQGLSPLQEWLYAAIHEHWRSATLLTILVGGAAGMLFQKRIRRLFLGPKGLFD